MLRAATTSLAAARAVTHTQTAAISVASSVFLVTGGGSGLGGATAEAIVAGGGKVGIIDIDGEKAEAMAEKLGAESAVAFQADVTSVDQIKAAVDGTVAKFGKLNGAVNAAGIANATRLLKTDLDTIRKVYDVNVVGTINTIQQATLAMNEMEPDAESGERGAFVNTASVAAFDGQIGQVAYSASKGAIHALSIVLARELTGYGIRCNTIAPGIFDTPLLASLPEKARQSLANQVPFPKRLGDPAEFGKAAVAIIENGYLNGETIRVDGALRMAAN
ncbi:short-chain dehydrogenase/reductase SDR [Thecamonas trahens ATCC 50062]|uniref:Short-chain dehydrogenase/reductase SDR n=1 Tax=Thecamonas trahens ATCC 50062 TaxID=461836 RepID=A0A0L0DL82_THETB|nr:short-chain dehydrogenase/reductase SDR [Thecamonas trahens ATCC 50062]KNC52796.1 short-chain dehydrogenase/reductase SDR [Thecamonas trahens ATCC 50062]|eukprot:XP_013755106.1 short-chain dehydrogenase/reductase SDR [Thecamonas trahens ATCC 50062]